jgi:histidinol-phosphate aminotransferase
MSFFDPKLCSLEPYIPGEQPKNIANLIKLNTNESPFPPSPKAVEAGKEKTKSVQLYSDPTATELVKAIASVSGVSEKCVAVGNGSDEVLAFLVKGFCPKGMVYNDITYGFYKVLAAFFDKKSTIIELESDFTIDESKYEGVEGTVFIANPNAPTGIILPLEKIEKILLQDLNRLVVVDEAYIDFGGESAVKLLGKYQNLAITRTYSKSRSLAGARLGYIIASEEIINGYLTVKNSFHPYNVNAITQAMGREAMLDKEYFDFTRKEIIKNREKLSLALNALNFTVTDSKANFVFASPKDGNGERLYTLLREKGILVRYFASARIASYARITVGSDEQTDALIRALTEIYGK